MLEFHSLHSDLTLAAVGMALVLAGFVCVSISREATIPRPLPAWRYLGYSLIILAVREWLDLYWLSSTALSRTGAHSTFLLGLACIPVLLAARVEAPPHLNRYRTIGRTLGAILFVLLAVCILSLIVSGNRTLTEQWGLNHGLSIAMRVFYPLATAFFLACTKRGVPPPTKAILRVLRVSFLFSLLTAVCPQPGPAGAQALPVAAVLNPLTAAAAILLAIMLWGLYARALGVIGAARWWPLLFTLCVMAFGLGFVKASSFAYRRIVKNNLAAAARNAARGIPYPELAAAATTPGSANRPDVADRLFGKVRELFFYTGHTDIALDVDALAVEPKTGVASAVIDIVRHPKGGIWAGAEKPVRELWDKARGRDVLFEGLYGNSSRPTLVVAPIAGPDGTPGGAAVLTVSSADLTRDAYLQKRPALLCLPPLVGLLLLLVGGQQRAWLSSRSVNRAEALKLGALGNDLAGVVITKGDIIRDVNKRFCDMMGLPAEELLGRDVAKTFTVLTENSRELAARVHASLEEKGRALFEISLRDAGGNDMCLMVYARKLNEDALDEHYIWESVDVTEIKRVEGKIREDRDNLRAFLDALPAAVFVKTQQGRYRLANSAFVSLIGKNSAADIVGKTIRELHPDGADEVEIHDDLCRDIRGSTLTYEQAFEIDGEKRFFEVMKKASLPDRDDADCVILGCMHDITGRKRAEDAIKAERHFLTQLIDALPVAVCFINPDRVIRLCDRDFCREAGVDGPEELIGRPYDEVAPFGPGDPAEDLRMLERGGGHSDRDFELNKNGRHRNFMLRRIAMSSADGQPLGLLMAFWDTTALVAAGRAARNADRAKAVFLSSMSHELRTPMNGIIGMADLITEHETSDPVQRLYAETIVKSAKTLQMVMDEVIDIATLDDDAKRFALVDTPFPLLTFVEEAAEIVNCIVGAWGIDLMLSYDFNLYPVYTGDGRKLRHILLQILTHCARLTADKRLLFTIKPDQAGPTTENVIFRVTFKPTDGLAASGLEDMFKRPVQIADDGKPTPDTFPGNGRIGLPLAWRFIQIMAGTLAIRDVDGGGVSCEVSLPLRPEITSRARLTAPDLGGMRIFLGITEAPRKTAVESSLGYAGAETRAAENRDELARLLRQTREENERCDLVLLDTQFVQPDQLCGFLEEMREELGYFAPAVMLIVTVRNFENFSCLDGDQVKSLLLPPLCPSELWFKAERIWLGNDPDGSKASAAASRTRRTTRMIRPLMTNTEVLLVEDNTVNQMVAIGILKRIGCTPVLAKNGQEAVERIVNGEIYDIILMDCMMPVMDGYEATGRIRLHERSTPGGKRNIIVALTAGRTQDDMEKCLASGMDGYMSKPITMEIMRDTMLRHLPGHFLHLRTKPVQPNGILSAGEDATP